MRVGLFVAEAAVVPGPAQPGVPVAVVVARRLLVAVSPCVPGVVVAKVAAGLVVVAPLERYRGVDFANRVVDFANRACRLGLVVPACFPVVLGLGVVVGLAGVVAAVAAVERYR